MTEEVRVLRNPRSELFITTGLWSVFIYVRVYVFVFMGVCLYIHVCAHAPRFVCYVNENGFILILIII